MNVEKTVFSDSHRAAISLAMKGKGKGVPKSPETIAKMKEAHKARVERLRASKATNICINGG